MTIDDRVLELAEQQVDKHREASHQPHTHQELLDLMGVLADRVAALEGEEPPPPPPPDEEEELPPDEEPTPTPTKGIWTSEEELSKRPMSGAAWDALPKAVAGSGNVSDMGSNHDVQTYGLALRGARTGDLSLRVAAIKAIESAIGTEGSQRWLDIMRNLGAYVLAADLMDVRSGPIYDWLAQFMTTTQGHNTQNRQITIHETAWNSGSNAAAHAGFVHAALAAYLGDAAELKWAWNGFRRYAGDKTSPHQMEVHDSHWAVDPTIAIQPKGAKTPGGCRLDGAVANDMLRGDGKNKTTGEVYGPCNPGQTNYAWVGLVGGVPAAVILQRSGFPAFDVADQALKRAAEYLKSLSWGYSDQQQAAAAKHLLNVAYGLDFPHAKPVGSAMTIGWTDFSHPDAASLGR